MEEQLKRPSRKQVWTNIVTMMWPFRLRFVIVVCIGLLSTGANLVEPLIYREAINDIAGLFVKKAKDAATRPDDIQDDSDEDPVIQYLQKKFSFQKSENPHTRKSVAPRTPMQALSTLIWAAALILIVNLIANSLWLLGENLTLRLSSDIEQNFIYRTFEHVLKLPLSFFSKRSSTALTKQINQSEEMSGIVNGFAQQIVPEVLSLIGILIIMFSQNVPLTLIALTVIPVYIFIAWRSASKLETQLAEYYDKWEEVSTRMQDALGGIKTVKLSGAEKFEATRFKKISDSAYNDYMKRSKLANKYIFIETILTRISNALVLGYGGYLTLENQLTPGDVVMFVAYLDRLYTPIDTLANLWVNLQQNLASITRAFNLMQYGNEEVKGNSLVLTQGRVDFRNIHFSYNKKKEVLCGISFTVQPGKITAIVGSSGAGKTTTVDLLLKLYTPDFGTIMIDDQDISGLDPSSIRQLVGIVSADGTIFRGTLLENIKYKRANATLKEVNEAAVAAGMEATLQRLPDGLNTIVGEGGFGLSVGERQRLQIARVLVARPRILILDEATANLDYATEQEIKNTLTELSKENTVIVIAHRYAMVRDADHVIVLSDGVVSEQGSPRELINNNGWFAKFAAVSVNEKK